MLHVNYMKYTKKKLVINCIFDLLRPAIGSSVSSVYRELK